MSHKLVGKQKIFKTEEIKKVKGRVQRRQEIVANYRFSFSFSFSFLNSHFSFLFLNSLSQFFFSFSFLFHHPPQNKTKQKKADAKKNSKNTSNQEATPISEQLSSKCHKMATWQWSAFWWRLRMFLSFWLRGRGRFIGRMFVLLGVFMSFRFLGLCFLFLFFFFFFLVFVLGVFFLGFFFVFVWKNKMERKRKDKMK